jgi:hypothetical protein
MKFPITRERIKAYAYATELEELRKEEIEKCFTVALKDLCDDFTTNIRLNPRDSRFVWRKLQTPRYFSPYLRLYGVKELQYDTEEFVLSSDEHLPRFVQNLREHFIGCNIIVDPLKKYLIIDWL